MSSAYVDFFVADDGLHGSELWVTNGTNGGTFLLKDINPGLGSANVSQLTNINGVVFFSANDGAGGPNELWRTDGTTNGTFAVSTAANGANPSSLIGIGGTLYYLGSDSAHGSGLFKSDGTTTTFVAAVTGVSNLTVVGTKLFFDASDAAGTELWSSDGTAAGTGRVADVNPGAASSNPSQLTALGAKVFFAANDGTHGQELFVTDGTAAGTSLVKDINFGPNGSSPQNLFVAGGKLFFTADDGIHGRQLWTSDGTAAGTIVLSSTTNGVPNNNFTAFNGKLYYQGSDASHAYGLYASDGTAAGTTFVAAVSQSTVLYHINGKLFFFGSDGSNTGIFTSDGTTGGTVFGVALSSFTNPTVSGSKVFFTASDATHGNELWVTDGTVPGTHITKDINPGPYDSNPGNISAYGTGVLFSATDPAVGTELFFSDGTTAGTGLVDDVNKTADHSPSMSVTNVTAVGTQAFFNGNDPTHGQELWVTDTTTDATHLVKDIIIGATGSNPQNFIVAGGKLFFTADDGVHGRQIWTSDGTDAGTIMLSSATNGAPWDDFTAFNGKLYYRGNGTGHSYTLYSSDGTVAGTTPVSTVQVETPLYNVNGTLFFHGNNAGTNSGIWTSDGTSTTFVAAVSNFSTPTASGNKLFFQSTDGGHGNELWVSDGTALGTHITTDINPGSYDSNPANVTAFNNEVVFTATEPQHATQVWISDGSANGTTLLKDVNPTADHSPSMTVTNVTAVGTLAFFNGTDPAHGSELWVTDTTTNDTHLVKDVVIGATGSNPQNFIVAGGKLFFTADDGVHGRQIWTSDGTDAGTIMLSSATNGAPWDDFTAFNGKLYYRGNGTGHSYTLYSSDGTVAGTTPVSTVQVETPLYNVNGTLFFHGNDAGTNSGIWTSDGTSTTFVAAVSSFTTPTVSGGKLFFQSTDGGHGNELWVSDGTALGTHITTDINPGSYDSNPANVTAFNNEVVFTATEPQHATQVWISDGSAVGTTLLKDVNPTADHTASLSVTNVTAVGTLAFFNGNDPTHGQELWVTDTTTDATHLVKDINVGATGSNPQNFIAAGGKLFFTADDGVHGRQIWTSDGTDAGTIMLSSATNGAPWDDFTAFNGKLYYRGNGTGHSYTLYSSDGTVAGTTPVSTVQVETPLYNVNGTLFFHGNNAGTNSGIWTSDGTSTTFVAAVSSFTNPVVAGNKLFFDSTDAAGTGNELWVSDGTSGGTHIVKDINPGANSSNPASLTAVGPQLFFTADDGAGDGTQIYVSDGTAANTTRLPSSGLIVLPGTSQNLTAAGGQLFFTANDGPHGQELWVSDGTNAGTTLPDGTNAGTHLVKDILVGTSGSNPSNLFEFNHMLYFTANDGTNGNQLWSSTGTDAGTGMMTSLSNGSGPSNFTVVGNKLFFEGSDSVHGGGLFVIDGFSSPQFISAAAYPYAGNFGVVNGKLYFQDYDGANGYELWTSDGTAAGTHRVTDTSVPHSANAQNFIVAGGKIFFSATDGVNGQELWVSDGTTAGTVLVKDINPGAGDSSPTNLFAFNGKLYFIANDGPDGNQIWVSDGTAAGTTMVTTPSNGSGPSNITVAGNKIFFEGSDSVHGGGLFVTDGTAAGTQFISAAAYPSAGNFGVVNGKLYFQDYDGVNGYELWTSDGTAAGTHRVTDTLTPHSSNPASFTSNAVPSLLGTSNASYTEEAAAATLSGSAVVGDPGSVNLASATVAITGGAFAGDVLATSTGGTSITASYSSATETLTLSGSDTLAHYQQVLDAVTFQNAENPNNYGSNPTRTVTWTLDDGGSSNNIGTATTTIGITNVNDAPTLSGTSLASWTEHGGAVTLAGAASVSDPDNLKLASATVVIAGGAFTGDVLATVTTSTNITASYDSATQKLTLTGSDTLANYQSVLDKVTFNAGENPTDFGSRPTRIVTWTLNDGQGSNNTSTVLSVVGITNVNDAPTLSGTANTSFTEEGAAVTLSGSAAVTDPDNLNLASATVAITGGAFAGDVLSTSTGGTSITASYDSTTEKLTLTGSDTLAHYQSVLAAVTFNAGENPTSFGSNPTRTVTWTLNDGQGSNNIATATTTVGITGVNDAPTLSGTANASFTEEGAAVTLSGSAAVTDPDNLNLVGATVAITGGAFVGDVLSTSTGGTSITASYNSTTEKLILTGSDTLANYQSVLDKVTFITGENPTDFGSNPTRTVTWTLNDGQGSNNTSTATTTVGITNVNDAPTLSGTANASFTEEGAAVTLSGSAAVTDPDNLNLASATVAVTAGAFAGDVLSTSTGGTSITVSYDSTTEKLTLTGPDTLAHYQGVLGKVAFSAGENPTDFGSAPTRTVAWTLNDGQGSNNIATATTTVGITSVNDAPTLSGTANASFTEEGAAVTLSGSAAVTDPDNLNLASATVAITGGAFAGDVLSTSIGGTSITASYNSTTEKLILTGSDTLANYQSVLDKVTFITGENPTDFGSAQTRTVTWTLNDGQGSNNTATAATTLTITNVDDPPTLAVTLVNPTWTEEGANVAVISGATASDPDNLNLAGATVSISGGFFTGDALSFTNSGAVTGSYNSNTGVLTFTGSDSLATYNTVLQSVRYNGGENPTDFGSDTHRSLTWSVNDGTLSSGAVTATLSVAGVNDPPTLAVTSANSTWTEHGAGVAVISGATASDPDNLNLASATVSISGGFFTGDTLSFTNSGAVTGSYNSSTGVLIFTGSDALSAYNTVLQSVKFNAGENPTDFGSDTHRTLSWTVNDGTLSSGAVTATLSVAGVDDPPTLAVTSANSTWTEHGAGVAVISGVTASDPDNLNLASATVSISGGFFTGDTLSFANSGAVTGSYNSSTGVLTFTGSDTLAAYNTALQSVRYNSGENPTDFGSDTQRTVTWTVNDGALSSGAATATLSVAGVDDPPTLAVTSANSTWTEHGTSVAVISGATASDPDNLNLATATVSISGGFFTGDTLSFTNSGAVTGSYNSSTGVLVFTGSDTLSAYNTVLQSVKFNAGENPTDFGSDTHRTLSWTVNDGTLSSAAVTAALSVANVDDAPTLAVASANSTWTEEQTGPSSVSVISSATVSDPDNLNLASATVSISGGFFTGDTLSFTNLGAVNGSYNSNTGVLTFTGSDTLATYNTVLQSVRFNGGENPTDFGSDTQRSLTWSVNDGTLSSAAVTATISITNVNDSPTLAGMPSTLTVLPSNTVTLAPSVTVSDADDLNLTSATVAITGGTGDVLATSTAGTSITASFDYASGILVLTGTDTLADYQTVLDKVTFNGSVIGTRTVSWVLNDGQGSNNLSTAQTETVNVTPDIPPTLSGVASSAAWTEEGATTTLSSSVTVTDPDSTQMSSATVSIAGGTFAGDVLAATGTASISVSYDSATETLVLTGLDSKASYQSVLDSVTFHAGENPTDFGSQPTRTITWVVLDQLGIASTAVTTTVGITNVNDPPTLSGVASSAAWTEESAAATLSGAVTVTDPDNTTLAGATVAITGGRFAGDGDVLSVSGLIPAGITPSYDSTTETLTLSGSDTLAHYQAVLDRIKFSAGENPTNFGASPTRTVTWTLDDGSGSFNTSTPVATTVSITNVNDAPTLSNVAASASVTEEGGAVTLSGAVAVTDADNLNLAGATVRVTGGTFTNDGDVLAASTAGTSITASYNSSTETLTLSGADTLAHYRQVLDYVTFAAGERVQQPEQRGDHDGQPDQRQRPADPEQRGEHRRLHRARRGGDAVGQRRGVGPRQSQPRQRHGRNHRRQVHRRR
jgi:ELWxxDGT repeat protein